MTTISDGLLSCEPNFLKLFEKVLEVAGYLEATTLFSRPRFCCKSFLVKRDHESWTARYLGILLCCINLSIKVTSSLLDPLKSSISINLAPYREKGFFQDHVSFEQYITVFVRLSHNLQSINICDDIKVNLTFIYLFYISKRSKIEIDSRSGTITSPLIHANFGGGYAR